MAENYALYISNRELLPNARFRQAAEGARAHFFAEDEGHTEQPSWVRLSFRWPEGTATADRLDIRSPRLPEELQETGAFVAGAGGDEMDHRLWMIHEKLMRSRNVLKFTTPPECAQHVETTCRQIAAESNALLYFDSSLWDPHGRLCIGSDGSFEPDAGWETLPSALERKAVTEERLRASGIPVLDSLPPIEADEESVIRPPWEVARRASALVTVAARAEGLEQQRAIQFLQAWGLWDAASPHEQAFLSNPHPAETERIQSLWRYECLWVMLWALGHVESLGLPSCVCDVRRAVKTVTGTSTDVFIGKSNLRPHREILDEADFIYRCHWAVKDAQANGAPIPAGMDPGVVIERHVALNWLRAYHSQPWDNVTPDT